MEHAYVAAVPGRLIPLDRERVLWREVAGERIAVLPGIDAMVLQQAVVVRRWQEHVEAIAAATRLPAERVHATLLRARSAGLLQQVEAFLPAGDDAPPAPAPLICIRTCDRPQLLSRLLDSLLEDERRFDVRRRYVIVDDSPDAAAQAAARAVAESFAGRSSSEVRLIAQREQQSLLAALGADGSGAGDVLARHGPAAASGGRAWNWSLLLAAGGTLALLDDDFRFPLRRPAGAAARFELDTEYVTETEFLDSPEGLLRLHAVDEDPYAFLVRPLGQPAGALLRRHGFDPESAAGGSAAALACLAAPARVVGVCTGVYGSLNFDSSVYLSGADAATMASMLKPPFDERRLNGDWLWHGRRGPQFVRNGGFTPLLLDARDLLPPTGTHGKSDDGLFLALLSICDSRSLILALPEAIGHFPPDGRDRRAAAESRPIEDVSTFCAATALTLAPVLRSEDRASRMTAVAAFLGDVARGSDAALAGSYLAWRDHMAAVIVQMLSGNLHQYGRGAPAVWIEHVRRAIAASEASIKDRSVAPARLALARQSLLQMSRALATWPTLWKRGGPALVERLPPLS